MSYRKYDDATVAKVGKLYRAGLSIADLCERFGVTRKQADHLLRRAGVVRDHVSSEKGGGS